jgi:hypothetical protein
MMTNFINMLVMTENWGFNHAFCDCDWDFQILIFLQISEVDS